jgi:hypothetical protein
MAWVIGDARRGDSRVIGDAPCATLCRVPRRHDRFTRLRGHHTISLRSRAPPHAPVRRFRLPMFCPQPTAGHSQPWLYAQGVVTPRIEAASDPGVCPGRGARARVPVSSSLAGSDIGQQKLGGVQSNGAGGPCVVVASEPAPVTVEAYLQSLTTIL